MKTRTTYTLIFFSILSAIFIAGYFLSISHIKSLGTNADKENSEVADLEVKYARATSLNAIAKSGRGDVERLNDFIVQPGGEIGVVKTLEQLARNLSLVSTTDSIDTQDIGTSTLKTKEFLHIVISTTGRWESTRRFLSLIETLPYNVKENRIDLFASGASPSGSQVWSGHFDISIVKNKEASQ